MQLSNNVTGVSWAYTYQEIKKKSKKLIFFQSLNHNNVVSDILYQDPYAKRFMKDEKITKTAYIANSGGLLGLCMGFRSAKNIRLSEGIET